MMSPGKHGRIIMGKYHERGQPCPVAVVVGMHPALFMLGGLEVPYGKSEHEAAGGILGEPMDASTCRAPGCRCRPTRKSPSKGSSTPTISFKRGRSPNGRAITRVKAGRRRRSASPPWCIGMLRSCPGRFLRSRQTTIRSISAPIVAARCGIAQAAGIPEGKGVWAHEAGGSRFRLTVAIKQLYGGHSKQAGMVAAHCLAGAYSNRWTIVVDDDIDPTNISDVIWAMCTRCDPREDVEIIRGGWSPAWTRCAMMAKRTGAIPASSSTPVTRRRAERRSRPLLAPARNSMRGSGRNGRANLPKDF